MKTADEIVDVYFVTYIESCDKNNNSHSTSWRNRYIGQDGVIYMIFLKVLAVVLGLAFLLFGYFIYFKKKYNLINGFEADFKAGRKKEEYAKKVGMIEFVVGIVLLITGVALILFA